MRSVGYFKIVVAGPLAVYLFFSAGKQMAQEAGVVAWSQITIGVLMRLVYVGIFIALCVDGMRALRTPRRSDSGRKTQ